MGICLDLNGVPILGGASVDSGFCALSALLPTAPSIDGLDVTCASSADCSGIGLSLCLYLGLPVVDNLLARVGQCVLGASTGPTTPVSDPNNPLRGIISLNGACTANAQCSAGLCVPSIVGATQGVCLLSDPLGLGGLIGPLGSTPTGTPTGLGTVIQPIVSIVDNVLDPLTPTGQPLSPVLNGVLDGVGSLVQAIGGGNPTAASGAIANPLPTVIEAIGDGLGGLGGSGTSAGPLAAVTGLTDTVGQIVGDVLQPAVSGGPAQPVASFLSAVVNDVENVLTQVLQPTGLPQLSAPVVDVVTQAENLLGGLGGAGTSAGPLAPIVTPILGGVADLAGSLLGGLGGNGGNQPAPAPASLTALPSLPIPSSPALPTLAPPPVGSFLSAVVNDVENVVTQVLQPTGLPQLSAPVVDIVTQAGNFVGGLGGTGNSAGPLAPVVTTLLNGVADLAGSLLGGLGGNQPAPAPAVPSTLITLASPSLAVPTILPTVLPTVAPTIPLPTLVVPTVLPTTVPGTGTGSGGLLGTVGKVLGGIL